MGRAIGGLGLVAMLALSACHTPGGAGDGASPTGGVKGEASMTNGASADEAGAVREVGSLLDTFHAAASRADGAAYFGCFAPEGVFLGTDATERWTVDEFRAYAKPYFDRGQGWTYVPRAGSRHVVLAGAGVAYFDELLDNAKYGVCRGTGVAVKRGAGGAGARWVIAHYSLSFMVPNEVAGRVVEITKPAAGK
jgi:hypothetical protein